MVIKANNKKVSADKHQSVAASSSTKSQRSPVISNSVSSNSESVTAQLDGVVDRTESTALKGATADRVLEPGISEDTSGEDLFSESIEWTAITLRPPSASLVAKGYKQYETRDWPTNHRGPIVIHAGRKPKSKQELREHDKVMASFKDLLNEDCPYSSVIAIAQLTDVVLMTEEFIKQQTETELRCGDWKVGRYAWKLENVQAIAPIPAVGKQGLWKWNAAGFDSLHIYPLEPWNPTDFGELHHKTEADGQLNLLEWEGTEPPDPDDYEFPEKFDEAFKAWLRTEQGKAKAAEFGVTVCNQSTDGSICAVESVQDSPTQESNCGVDRPTTFVNGTATANESLQQDSPESTESTTSRNATSTSAAESNSLQPALPVSPFQLRESDLQLTIPETVSPMCSEPCNNSSQTSQLLKTLPDSLVALTPPATNQEVTSDSSSIPYPRSGSMLNGLLSPAPTLAAPGEGNDSLLLRSPGGLSSTGETRPPGKSRLESQLNQLELIQNGEVAAPEFLETGFNLPIGWTNPEENRIALELAQVQAQQLQSDHKSESPAEIQTIAIEGKLLETPSIGELPLSDSNELIISLNLPPNIGSLTKNELISLAGEQHRFISNIERKEFELALEKLYRARLIGVYLQEFKKKCQYGEFQNQLKQAGIGERSAQNYMAIAKDWEIIESKAQFVALLSEDNERPSLSINWALQAVRDEKKQLKSAAPPKDPDGWRTPNNKDQPVVDLVKKALGGQIYLDPASDSGCNIPATMRYFKWNDGLAKHNIWQKTVFINPPFSDPFPWVERCCFEFARGNVSAAIMLLKAGVVSNVGTGELINKYASAICHWRGRINFLNDEGNPIKGSDFDCVLIYFGARLDLFRQKFGGRGTIATIENHYSSVNKKFMTQGEKAEFGNVEAQQKQLAAAVGLGNGRSVLPDMRDADRERNERYDPHTVVDILSSSMPTTPAKPLPVSENLVQPIGEVEVFDETPLAVRQFEKAKENTLNDYITAISGNLSDFSDDQIAFLAKIINEESAKRIGF